MDNLQLLRCESGSPHTRARLTCLRKDFGKQDVNSLVWNVDLPAGTSVTLRLTDSAGTVNYAQAVTIRASPDASLMAGLGS